MAKSVLIVGVISLAIIFMAVTVSSSRITITIAEDGENPQTQSCQQQIQQAQQLRLCRQYLRKMIQSEEEDQQMEDIQGCCSQLQQIQDPRCRCEGLRQVVQQGVLARGQLQEREKQEMLQTAQNLPGLCRLSPQRCDIQTRTFY